MEVGRAERQRKPGARLVAEKADHPRHVEALRQPRQLAVPRPEADHHDLEPLEVAEERRRADERVEVLGVPDVPRVHDDERVVDALLPRPRVLPRLRPELVRVDPVRDHRDPLGRRALLLEAQLHRLADRDDAVGPSEVERDEPPERAEDDGVLEPLDALRDLGEHVLADDEERDAEPARDEQPDVADDGRVGHAEDEVGPLPTERRQHRVAEVARVVRRAQVDLRAVVGRRADPDDLDAVPRLPGRKVVPAEVPRDDGDVVVERERLAELGEELRRRLDARPVVLVEHEDPGARGHSTAHAK